MTLEQRARLIADLPGTADIYSVALKHLRQAVDEALARAGVASAPTHDEWVGR